MSEEAIDKTRMQAEERHAAILERVDARGSMTVRDLAAELGVSAVTVRVDVRELARRGLLNRVHGGATRLPADGSQPPESAVRSVPRDGVVSGRPGTAGRGTAYAIGMVVPHASYYYPAVVRGARTRAESHGARLVLGVSQNDVAEERALVARLLESGVDGLIIATRFDPQQSPETETWLRSLPVPVVLAERRAGRNSGDVEQVATDHEQGAYEAVHHLAALGHRQIGLIQFATITAPRLRTGYDAALAALGLPQVSSDMPQELSDDSPLELERTAEAVLRHVRSGELDALIVHHDLAALPLLSRLLQAGIKVPDDLAVVAYDDELAALSDPPLTAVAPPRVEVGATAFDLLIERIEHPTRALRQVLLRPQLRVRSSCGAEARGTDLVSSATALGTPVGRSAGVAVTT